MAARELLIILLVLCLLSLHDAFSVTKRNLIVPQKKSSHDQQRRNTALIHTPHHVVNPTVQEEEQQEQGKEPLQQENNNELLFALDAISESSVIEYGQKRQYDWKEFWPKEGLAQKLRWIVTGASFHKVNYSNAELQQNWSSLARMLILLREYETQFGAPDFGGPSVQRKILSSIVKDLYGSGTPTWVLEAIVARVAEGLTGKEGVQLMLLPNRAFIFYPANDGATPGTELFRMSSGFYIAKLGALESVVVRLASFAGNTRSIERRDAGSLRMPRKDELVSTEQQELKFVARALDNTHPGEEELAKEILNLAGESYGLFYFLNSPKFQEAVNATDEVDTFWEVEDSTRNVFSRLAAREASTNLETIQSKEKFLYKPAVVGLFRFLSSAGACAMWFRGSLPDMLVSGSLALMVAYLGSKRVLAFEERVLTEVVSSWFVGVIAGLLAIRWPHTFCFGAIAVASVLDLLQGFKVVFAVIEVMTKNVVTGTARLLEGILYTGLLSYSLKFGLDFAFLLLSGSNAPHCLDTHKFLQPTNPISILFFPLLLPLATTGWSGLFRPSYADLPLMAFHGMLAMCLNWAGSSTFVSAMCVTFSAGIISRFTGREALGNTFAGLYALTPGTYMARALLETSKVGFLESVLVAAVTIGLGAWTGTILCSPTVLGKSSGLNGLALKKSNGDMKKPSMLCF